MDRFTQAILTALGNLLNAVAGTLYDVIIFPAVSVFHGFVKNIPVIGPNLVSALDLWFKRLSDDWPEKLE